MKLRLCKIHNAYIDYLNSHLSDLGLKEQRPIVGIVLTINNVDYYAPLYKAREKHYTHKGFDCFMIFGRKKIKHPKSSSPNELVREIKAVVNLNCMIPIPKGQVYEIDFSTVDEKMKDLYNEEVSFLNRSSSFLIDNAVKVLNNYNTRINNNMFKRCYNFPALEELCRDFELEE